MDTPYLLYLDIYPLNHDVANLSLNFLIAKILILLLVFWWNETKVHVISLCSQIRKGRQHITAPCRLFLLLFPPRYSLPIALLSLSFFLLWVYFILSVIIFFNLCGFILEEKKEVGEEEEKNKFKIGIRVWGCFAKLQVVKYFATCKKKICMACMQIAKSIYKIVWASHPLASGWQNPLAFANFRLLNLLKWLINLINFKN